MKKETGYQQLRVIAVIPVKPDGTGMTFCKTQVESLRKLSVNVNDFLLFSRTNPFVVLKEFIGLINMIKIFRPHLVHAHYGTMTAFMCATTTFLTKTPLVVTFHGSDLNKTFQVDGLVRDFLGRLLSQIAALKAANIICVSKRLSEQLWWKKSCVEVIPNGIDIELFYPISKEEARGKLGWNLNEKIVLFNANNPDIKRLDVAKESIIRANEFMTNIRLEVLKGNVPFEMMPLYLNASDCLLVCSDSEGSPTIVKEALACNLPVVSVDVGDVINRLEGVIPSRIVEKKPEALGKAIVEILNMNSRSNGSVIIRKELSEEQVAKKIINVYWRIINRGQ